jgi:hypothetical protein
LDKGIQPTISGVLMIILGAGMAGLLAANLLRKHNPTIFEKQDFLPKNHDALLRFRSDAISKLTGIPFKKVTVHKGIAVGQKHFTESNLRFANLYSQKVTRKISNRSILNIEPSERWIAPNNFVEQLANGCDISFSTPITAIKAIDEHCDEPTISTLPMPMMMGMAQWPKAPECEFVSRSIWVITADIIDPESSIYQTIYFPGDETPVYRASITGSKLIIELIAEIPVDFADGYAQETLVHFGIHGILSGVLLREQKYGKIAPMNEDLRKQFIMGLTNTYNIYSLGRFATWRNILLDDLVRDIAVIGDFITTKDHYQRALSATHKPNWEAR